MFETTKKADEVSVSHRVPTHLICLLRNRSVVGRPAEYRQKQLQTPVVRFLCTANCQDTQFDLPDFVKILQSIQ